jgi:phosphoglycolate phosphatase-like HAD superfamily hydrolase
VRLILFDIDGTLLHCGGQTRALLGQALEEIYQTPGALDRYDFAGKTDDQIVFDSLTSAGLSEEAIAAGLPAAKKRYFQALEERLDRSGMTLMKGVVETLESLLAHPAAKLGLLTGNWEKAARIKLSRWDLNRFFRVGAFGDGQRDRSLLPPIALARATRHFGGCFHPADAIIVGDTLLDVSCARAHGIGSLAVATGKVGIEELVASGADWVLPSLADASRLMPLFSRQAGKE